ncbi:uncharacterized protein [Dermacentor albipictus]|uniref:uncharacterized protein isoform X2 n=1 Tax=Dermacentor albipictus TaxID=60249 RepID=UPI0031FD0B51
MQADGDQVGAVFEDDAPMQANSLSRTQAGETSEIPQQLGLPTQPDSEWLLRNPHQGGPLRSSLLTSSSGNQEHINDAVRGSNQNAHEQSVGVVSNEHGAAPEPLPTFADAFESPSSPASQVTQPSYEDSTDLPTVNAAAVAGIHPLAALQRVRPVSNLLINTHGQSQAAASGARGLAGAERLFTAGSPQRFSPVVFSESSEITFAGLRARILHDVPSQRSALRQPSTDSPADTVSNGTYVAEDDAGDASANARTCIAGQRLERLVGAHTRRMTLGQQNEASIRVRVLPDLEILEQGPCRITVMLANDEAGVPEGTHHLAEWETFTRALLAVHVCIHRLCLSISAVSRSPRHFYRGFSLRDGTAVVDVEVSAFRDPCTDFVLPYLRNLCQLRMVQRADIQFQDISLPNCDVRGEAVFRELLRMDAPLELDVNRNLARIFDALRDMPFLRQILIYLSNTGSGPCEPRQISLNLTHHSCTGVRRLRYEVDATYAHFLQCQCANERGVSTTTGVETSIIPTLSALRELTCSTGDLVPYTVSVTHPAMHGTYDIHVLSIVCMRDED